MMLKVATMMAGLALSGVAPTALAAELAVPVHQIDAQGVGKAIGRVEIGDGKGGLVLTTRIAGLPSGKHGFHVHENPDCGPKEKDGKSVAGLAAGGHYDPGKTGKHEGPRGRGHLGDLPELTVDQGGNANVRLVAPRLKLADLKGRSLMIHEGGDNYADAPKPLGGGGARIACGVVD